MNQLNWEAPTIDILEVLQDTLGGSGIDTDGIGGSATF